MREPWWGRFAFEVWGQLKYSMIIINKNYMLYLMLYTCKQINIIIFKMIVYRSLNENSSIFICHVVVF